MTKPTPVSWFLITLLFTINLNVFATCPEQQVAISDQHCVERDQVHYVQPKQEKILKFIIKNAKEGDYIILKSGDHYVTSTSTNTGLAIKNKKSLTILGEDGAWLKTRDGWVVILDIASSEDITIQNIGMVHEVERGYCYGSVIKLSAVKNVKIRDVVMDGSGTQAIEMENAHHVEVIGGKAMRNTWGVFYIVNSTDITIKDLIITENDNSGSDKMGILDIENSNHISFIKNKITNNTNKYFKKIISSGNVTIKQNQFSNNTFVTNKSANNK